MKDPQLTPSVNFSFDDHVNNNTKTGRLFDLSETNYKMFKCSIQPIKGSIIDFHQQLTPTPVSNLKTQQFFQQFDKNFIVIFDNQTDRNQKNNENKCQKINKSIHSKSTQQFYQTLPLQTKHSHVRQDSINLTNNLTITSNNQILQENIEKHKIQDKQNNKQIFSVKNRTVFKNKQNIRNFANCNKVTNKKLISHIQIDFFNKKSQTCRPIHKKQMNKPFFYTHPLNFRKNHHSFPKRQETIFHLQGSQIRNMNIKDCNKKNENKQNIKTKAKKRSNIFQMDNICF